MPNQHFISLLLHYRSCEVDSSSRSHRLPALSETLAASPLCDRRGRSHDLTLWPVARGTELISETEWGFKTVHLVCNLYNIHTSKCNTSFFFSLSSSSQGVKRFDARDRVISALMERKLFRAKKDHPMSLPICR